MTEDQRRLMAEQGEWDQLAIRDAATHAAHSQHTAPSEALLLQRTVSERWLRNLYLKSPYYDPAAAPRGGSYVSLTDTNPVRLLINTMLGFIVTAESLLCGGRAKGERFHSVAPIVTGLFFWELLTRALRLYGWAPVYAATQHVVQLLIEATRAGGR
jgi:hypothetical protein